MTFNFNNNNYVTPVTASVVDDSLMDSKGASSGNVLALIGESNNIYPATPIKLASYSAASRLFGADEPYALKAIEKAFNPSPETGAPDYIVFVNSAPIKPATLTLKDTTPGTALDAIAVTAKVPGLSGANIYIALKDGTLSDTKTLTVNNYAANDFNTLLFTIKNSNASTMTITDAALTIIDIQRGAISGAADTPVTTEFPFSGYKTLKELLNAVESIIKTVTITRKNVNVPPDQMDCVKDQSIATAFKVTNTVAAVANKLNNSKLVTAVCSEGNLTAIANLPKTALINAITNDTGLADWQAAIDSLKTEVVNWVVPLTSDVDVRNAVIEHCDHMSSIFLERRAIFGIYETLGTDKAAANAAAIAIATDMDNDRASVVHLGFYDGDLNGKPALYPPYVLAALLGGMICGVTPGTALTNKRINVQGLSRALINPDDTDDLLAGGVICCWKNHQGIIKVLQSVTTSTNTTNYNQREMSVGVASDYTAKAIRDVLDPLRGQKNTPYLLAEVVSRAESRLKQLAIPEPIGEGVLVGNENNPAYRGLTATQQGDSIRLDFQCSPVIPANYIGITIHTVPYAGSTI